MGWEWDRREAGAQTQTVFSVTLWSLSFALWVDGSLRSSQPENGMGRSGFGNNTLEVRTGDQETRRKPEPCCRQSAGLRVGGGGGERAVSLERRGDMGSERDSSSEVGSKRAG